MIIATLVLNKMLSIHLIYHYSIHCKYFWCKTFLFNSYNSLIVMFFLIFFDYVALLKVTYVPFSVGVKTMKKIAQNSHPNEVVLNHENADV